MDTATTADPNNAEYKSPAYEAMRARWQFVRDIRGGTETIRVARETYLPRFEAEEKIDYNARLGMTFAFDALDETIHAMVGLALRNDPVLEDDVPAQIKLDWENIDGQRTHGDVFAQHTLENAIQDGHSAILVDYPVADPTLDLSQQQNLGLRPYAVQVTIDQITAWRLGMVLGKRCVVMVKLLECTQVEDGDYGTKEVKRYRIYRQLVDIAGQPFVTLEVKEESKTTTGTVYLITRPETMILGPKWIPLFVVYGGEQVDILASRPPLMGLAYSNLDHTQVGSDHRYSMHRCAVPIPIFIGRVKTQGVGGQATIGSSTYGIDVGVGGDGKYMEPTGAALEALRAYKLDLERRMGSQGLDFMRDDNNAQQTATAERIQNTKGESKLARAVRSLEDGLEGMNQAFADFYGIKEGGGSVTLAHEFADTILTPDEIRLLMDLEERGELTLETLLGEIQKGGRMLQGVDVKKEVKAVEAKMAEEPAVQAVQIGPDGKPVAVPKPGEPTPAAAAA